MSCVLQCGRFELSLDRPRVMGILNLTPDSFSDGGRWNAPDAALAHAHRMIEDGADLLDLGAESTRPGAPLVPADIELERLLPVVRGLSGCGVPLSVDTRKPVVMRAVLEAGVDLINDVEGFASDDSIAAVAGSHAGLCVMHMQGEPQSMQAAPVYQDVVDEVSAFLRQRVERLERAGVARRRIALDPGIGFGKTLEHNLSLLARLDEVSLEGCAMLVGVSRKSMIGALTGRGVEERLAGSLAAALAAVEAGARIIRVHDVAATRDALRVWRAIDAERRHPSGSRTTAVGQLPAVGR